jgi:hypothetical protein
MNTKVIRMSWEGTEIGTVKFLSDSWVQLTYLGDVYILEATIPLSNSEGRTKFHHDNWKYHTIGLWLVSGKEV